MLSPFEMIIIALSWSVLLLVQYAGLKPSTALVILGILITGAAVLNNPVDKQPTSAAPYEFRLYPE